MKTVVPVKAEADVVLAWPICIYYLVFLSWLESLTWENTCGKGNLERAGDGWGAMLHARHIKFGQGNRLVLHNGEGWRMRRADSSPPESSGTACCWAWVGGDVCGGDLENYQLLAQPGHWEPPRASISSAVMLWIPNKASRLPAPYTPQISPVQSKQNTFSPRAWGLGASAPAPRGHLHL